MIKKLQPAGYASVLLLVLGFTNCPGAPAPWTGRAMVSWPESSDATNAHRFWSNSPTIALIRQSDQGISNRLVAAFNDSSGEYSFAPGLGGTLNPCDPCNDAGVAISDDFGQTWQRPTHFLPQLPAPSSLMGSAQLATVSAGVISISLARRDSQDVRPPAGNPRLVVAHTTGDGVHWSEPTVIAEVDAPAFVRAPSVSVAGETVVATWTAQGANSDSWSPWSATSDDGGRTWAAPRPLMLSGRAESLPYATVRLVSPQHGYVAYSTFASQGPRTLFVDGIIRPNLDGSGWASTPRFQTSYRVNTKVWIRPPSSEADPGQFWSDESGFAFDVGNVNPSDGSARLYLAYRDVDELNRSSVRLAYCGNSPNLDIACAEQGAWQTHLFGPSPSPRTLNPEGSPRFNLIAGTDSAA
jgi:hypothetical protein